MKTKIVKKFKYDGLNFPVELGPVIPKAAVVKRLPLLIVRSLAIEIDDANDTLTLFAMIRL